MQLSPLLGGHLLNGPQRSLSPLPPPPPLPDPPIEVTIEVDNTVTLQAGSGDVTLTVDSPAEYAGSYVFDPDALQSGPVNLVPPALTGPDADGLVNQRQGLWVYDAAVAAPVVQSQWMQNGTALPGETGATYTAVPGPADHDITLLETATDLNGTVSVPSAPVTVPGITGPAEVLVLADERTRTGSASSFTLTGLALGTEAPTRDIILVSCLVGNGGVVTTGVQIAGIPATQITTAQSEGSRLVSVSAWQARVPTGSTGDVSLTTSANSSRQHITLYQGVGLTVENAIGVGGTNSSILTLPVTTAADGAILAVAANNNGEVFSWDNIDKLFDVNIAQSSRHVSAALRSTTAAEALEIIATHPDTAQLAGVALSVS